MSCCKLPINFNLQGNARFITLVRRHQMTLPIILFVVLLEELHINAISHINHVSDFHKRYIIHIMVMDIFPRIKNDVEFVSNFDNNIDIVLLLF